MLGLLEALAGYVSVPAWAIVALLLLFLISQVIGEVIELCGKVAPGFMKLRKKSKEKREKESKCNEMIARCEAALEKNNKLFEEFTALYNDDNMEKRNGWMNSVNTGISKNEHDISDLAEKLEKIYDISMKDHIEALRSVILGFANRVSDKNSILTHEEFRRAFTAHEDYEAFLEENGLTNGQVDVAYRVISEDYAERLRNHEFLEDKRGYN